MGDLAVGISPRAGSTAKSVNACQTQEQGLARSVGAIGIGPVRNLFEPPWRHVSLLPVAARPAVEPPLCQDKDSPCHQWIATLTHAVACALPRSPTPSEAADDVCTCCCRSDSTERKRVPRNGYAAAAACPRGGSARMVGSGHAHPRRAGRPPSRQRAHSSSHGQRRLSEPPGRLAPPFRRRCRDCVGL